MCRVRCVGQSQRRPQREIALPTYPAKFIADSIVGPNGRGAAFTDMRSACAGEADDAKILVTTGSYAEAAGDVAMKDGQHLIMDRVTLSANAISITGAITTQITGDFIGDITVGAGATLNVALETYSGTIAKDPAGFVYGQAGTTHYGTTKIDVAAIRIGGTVIVVGTDDDDTMATATDTTIATSESIKAYVDSVAAATKIQNVTTVNDATYDILATDDILSVTRTATGACAIEWKTAQIVSGRVVIIKDAGGNASAFNITLTGESGETIDGAASAVISGDHDSITVYCNGTNLFVA